MYKIIITKMQDNPLYDAEKAEAYRKYKAERADYYGGERMNFEERVMLKQIEVPALTVDLTDEEFKAIKKSVMEVM